MEIGDWKEINRRIEKCVISYIIFLKIPKNVGKKKNNRKFV